MDKQIRKLMLNVIKDHSAFEDITLPLYFLDGHFPPTKLEKALSWLIAQGFTGPRFVEWFKFECMSSNLEMHRKLLEAVEKLPRGERRRIRAGVDFT